MGLLDRFRRAQSSPAAHGSAAVGEPAGAAAPAFNQTAGPAFAVLDIETTGLSAATHRILDIALIRADVTGRVIGEWATRVNPQGPLGATHIHGITEPDVQNAPTFPQIIADVTRRLSGAVLVAHNAPFDLAFLRAEYARAGWRLPFLPSVCTLEASTYHLPGLPRRRLADCCQAIGSSVTGAHSALGDARATAGLLAAFMHPSWGPPPRPEDLALLPAALAVRWPSGPDARVTSLMAGHPALPTGLGRSRPGPLSDQARRVMAEQHAAPPPVPLVQLVRRFSLVDALDEGAPPGSVPYLEKLAGVLEDGILTAEEAGALHEVTALHDLTADDVADAHRAFVLAMAHQSVADGKISRAERSELTTVAGLLHVALSSVSAALAQAARSRHTRLGAGLAALPVGWQHGEPLHVGDKVVFTGCDPMQRAGLEQASEAAGVRVMSAISQMTALLVTDGSTSSTKMAKARQLGTRQVDPHTYSILLAHLQPSRPVPS